MHILLSTYSYYPYNWGGTEVYVSGLAEFLLKQGHNVTVIASMSPTTFEDHPLFYEDEQLKTIEYFYNSVKIIGVIIKNETTTEIYSKFSEARVPAWLSVLNKLTFNSWDVLHIHANISSMGKSLLLAAKLHSSQIKIIVSYHLPISCVKGTLLFANTIKACEVKPTVEICTACFISDKQNWSYAFSKKISAILPSMKFEKLPTMFRFKFLIKKFIDSFHSLNNEVDCWQVFSKQIKSVMLLNGLEEKKIVLIRHGVNSIFFANDATIISRQADKTIIFLYAARFDKVKGFSTLLNAWNGLPEIKERELWIVGEEQAKDARIKERMEASSKRADIKWLGAKNQQDLAGIMKKVHCTVIPSEWVEIGPLVFHEAIAAGSDVIASDLGGCKLLAELYNIKSNLFIAGNIESLQHAIVNFKYSNTTLPVLQQTENYEIVENEYHRLTNMQISPL